MSGARRCRFLGGVLAAVLGALVLLAVADSAWAQVVPGTAEIKRVTGRVEILRKGQTQWIPAVVGAKLAEGDEIRSFPGAFAELELPDTSNLLLAENSRMVVSKLAIDPQNQSRLAIIHLSVGKVRAAIATAAITLVRARQSNFIISTPTAVAAARGTVMVVGYNPATRTTLMAVLRGQALFADVTTRTPVTVGVNNVATQVGTRPPSAPIPITALPAPAQAQLPTPASPATAGQPALVAPPAPPPPTPQVASVVTSAAVQTAPAEAVAVTAGIVAAAPEAAPQVTAAAVAAAPAQAVAITTAAVTAAPAAAPQIAAAAVAAAPAQAVAITAAAATAAPAQAAAISAAVATAVAAVPVAVPAVAVIAAPPLVPVPVATVGQDIQQTCASPPCP